MALGTDEENRPASPLPISGQLDGPKDPGTTRPVQEASKPNGQSADGESTAKADRSQAIIAQINTKLNSSTTDPVQQELAGLLLLLDTAKKQDDDMIGLIEVAVNALFSEQPNLALAKTLRREITRRLRASRPSFGPTYLAFGLFFFAYGAIPAFLAACFYFKQAKVLGLPSEMVLAVAIAGACGSIASILQRIQDFRGKVDDRTVLIFQGFFKPILGLLFALFVFFVIEGNLIPITHTEGTELYFFIALAFVCGFSERFASDIASDIASKPERVAGGAAEDKKA